MRLTQIAVLAALVTASASVMAQDCSMTVDSTDAMRFSTDKITISKACKDFTLNLTHSGKLADKVMGHNIVITKADDMKAVASEGMSAGLENNYVKVDDKRVVVHTEIIGGGEKTSVKFPVSSLTDGTSYVFFCSFPGHSGIMKGTVELKP